MPETDPGSTAGPAASVAASADDASGVASTPAATAGAAPEMALERAVIQYQSGRYQRCAAILRDLVAQLEPETTPELRLKTEARTYLAACLVASGRRAEASQQFREAILEDRLMEAPDPVVFPPSVVDLFVAERSQLLAVLRRRQEQELRQARRLAQQLAERERERVAELERLAATEVIVQRRQPWEAWIPFGVGQFHNGDRGLGWFFFSTELALAGTAIVATSIELGLHSLADGGRAGLDPAELNPNVRRARRVGTAAWVGLAGVSLTGVIQARIAFVPERVIERRRRPLPTRLRGPESRPALHLGLSPLRGGSQLVVAGRF